MAVISLLYENADLTDLGDRLADLVTSDLDLIYVVVRSGEGPSDYVRNAWVFESISMLGANETSISELHLRHNWV